jgi:hypothetical protein
LQSWRCLPHDLANRLLDPLIQIVSAFYFCHRAVELVAPSLIAFLGAYDIWRDLKVRALLKDGEPEQGA